MNDMIRECSSRGVKLELVELYVSDNNLSNIDGSSFASLFITSKLSKLGMNNCSLSSVVVNDMIRECSSRGVKLELVELYVRDNNLSNIDGSSFASLFITSKLSTLGMNNCNLSSIVINDMIRECSSRGVKLELVELNVSDNNLSNIDGSSFASLFITSKLNILGMNNCSLSGVIMNDMIRDCSSRGVKLELVELNVSDNNLSNIDGSSFASLFITSKLCKLVMNNCSLSGVIMNDMIRECSSRGVKLELVELYVSDNNLSNIDGSSFASLFITSKLSKLGMNNCSLSSVVMNDMFRECSSRGVKLELVMLYVIGNNLSNIDWSSFASLFITSKLNILGMNNCSLSSVVMNDMIRECSSRGVKLELVMLYVSDNNLSNIDGSSFASLFIASKLNILGMNNCSLSGVIMNDMIRECSCRGVKLELVKLYVSDNNLSNIDGSSFASLFITSKLNILGMNNCSLSGVIINDMIRECSSRGVQLELVELNVSDNNLSNIDGSSFASLFITSKLNILVMNNCNLSSVVMNDMIRECSSRGVKLELELLFIYGNNLSNIDGSSFASLFITSKLSKLGMNNCNLSSVVMNNMIRECSSRGVKLELVELYVSDNNLSNIDGSSFASLFITSKLSKLGMNNCSLSSVVMNDMFRECSSREVKLELVMLYVSGNNLSNIDGSSFASLFITSKLNILGMNNCSLSSVVMNDMIRECSSRGVQLELVELNVGGNNLSNIDGSSFASLFITSKLSKLGMDKCNLSSVVMNDMIRECSSRGVKLELELLFIYGNNLSNIDGSSFASLFITSKLSKLGMNNCSLSSVVMNDMIRECSSRGVKLELVELNVSGNNLSNIDGFSFASLFITSKLSKLGMNNCSLSSVVMNDMIRECSSRGVKLELELLGINGINLSNIDGYSFASLFITSKLCKLGMNSCSLSGVIMNDMIRECSSRGVKLELVELNVSDNNLSDIDGSSFASLFITSKLNMLGMNNCSLSSVVMNDMIRECSSRGVKLELVMLYVGGNNLSNIDGSSFSSLFITSKLNILDMNNCSLSGVIINNMIRECSSRGVKLELVELYVGGNNLSNIDGSSFSSLFITSKLSKLGMNSCSLSVVIMNDMVRECSSRGVKLEISGALCQ
ncbi:uncharacterized protein LOC117104290 [Anneissia japonica]|uniref:uncharacterized protein LOC117104290 n=1 Tax=Anneissia japonica TaxID=1529436 RepID=UPI001425B975|nr:uncharacterized protein LOC117104290 [Anneissia japonica]